MDIAITEQEIYYLTMNKKIIISVVILSITNCWGMFNVRANMRIPKIETLPDLTCASNTVENIALFFTENAFKQLVILANQGHPKASDLMRAKNINALKLASNSLLALQIELSLAENNTATKIMIEHIKREPDLKTFAALNGIIQDQFERRIPIICLEGLDIKQHQHTLIDIIGMSKQIVKQIIARVYNTISPGLIARL